MIDVIAVRKKIIPARTNTVIAAMTDIAEGIADEAAKGNDTEVEAEEMIVNILATKMTVARGVIRATANPAGRSRGGNGKKIPGGKRSVANERTRNGAAMIIQRRRHPTMIPAIHHTTKEGSPRKRRRRKKRKAAGQKSAGVSFLGKK